MTELNLQPYARKFIISANDSWLFKVLFQEQVGDTVRAVDIRGFVIKATLFQFYNEQWNIFQEFERRADQINLPNPESGIYLDLSDDNNSTFVFSFDWVATQVPGTLNLNVGQYRLMFHYSSPLGSKKTFLDYLVNVNNNIRTDELPQVLNREYVLMQPIPDLTLNISNTRIS